jgi:ABC-type enterochelin transport system permease subunit
MAFIQLVDFILTADCLFKTVMAHLLVLAILAKCPTAWVADYEAIGSIFDQTLRTLLNLHLEFQFFFGWHLHADDRNTTILAIPLVAFIITITIVVFFTISDNWFITTIAVEGDLVSPAMLTACF